MGTKRFDRALQEWINQNTGGRLKEQSAGLTMNADTILALVSTIYYRAKWSHEFSKGATAPREFHAPSSWTIPSSSSSPGKMVPCCLRGS